VTPTKELSLVGITFLIFHSGDVTWREGPSGVMASYLKHDIPKGGKLGTQYRHNIVGMPVERP
jgi:hypothetical protein